jgi:hypothetical protein
MQCLALAHPIDDIGEGCTHQRDHDEWLIVKIIHTSFWKRLSHARAQDLEFGTSEFEIRICSVQFSSLTCTAPLRFRGHALRRLPKHRNGWRAWLPLGSDFEIPSPHLTPKCQCHISQVLVPLITALFAGSLLQCYNPLVLALDVRC